MKRLVILLLVLAPIASAQSTYLRAGAGFANSLSSTFRDRNCASTSPAALFGCGNGIDNRPFGASGDFGNTPVWEIGAGVTTRRLRAELALTTLTALTTRAEANFTGVRPPQPVTGDVRSRTAMIVTALDLGHVSDAGPFITFGAGAARNEVSPMRYAFPSIAADAVTITPGGTHTGFAWSAGGGVATRIARSVDLDVTLRYEDLGEVRTKAAPATIVRPRGTFVVGIDETRAPLRTIGLMVSLRFHR